MSKTTPRVRRLMSQANRLAEQNRFSAAEALYREIAAESPDIPDVMLAMARVVRDEEERQDIYLRVLEIDPKNYEAKRGVAGEVMSVWHGEDDPNALPEIEPAIVKPATAAPEPIHIETFAEEPVIGEAETEEPGEVVGLRCNRCNKPITIKNSVHTPVGYRCNDCMRELEETYFTANMWHYLVSGFVGFLLALPAAFVMGLLSFWLVAIFAGSAVGTLIGRLAFRAAGRNRGRYLPIFVAVMMIIACIVAGLLTPGFLAVVLFAAFAISAAYYQLR